MTFYETIKLLEGKTIKEMDCTKNGHFKTVTITTVDGESLKIIATVAEPFKTGALQIQLNDEELKFAK